MAESGYGLAGWGWVTSNLSNSNGLRGASAVLLLGAMYEQGAAFHAAGAAYSGDDI
ncbi:hypothetical protein Q2432_27490 [Escherichia coli]|nr:hypothetical protein [Escherichia coli]